MDMQTNQNITKADQQYYLEVFKRYPIAFDRGKGSILIDIEGKEYIDALAGIAVNNLGYGHPEILRAIREQSEKLMHISNFFATVPQVELSKKLIELSGLERAFFTNSGAESVEGAIKIARKYGYQHDKSGTILSFAGSFHGRTLATIATGKRKMQVGFGPMPSGFHQIEFNDLGALRQAIEIYSPAGLLIEPIQGEGGIRPVDPKYISAVRKLCDETHTLLIFDEIQCGIGRTGTMFYHEQLGVKPDIMTLAKGLGGGMPIGAIMMSEKVNNAMDFGDHGTTFGGNPLACAVSLACVNVISEPDFLKEVKEKGDFFTSIIKSKNHPDIKEIRGAGLMIGIDLNRESKPVAAEMLHRGVVANATADTVIRIVPPLVISKDQLEQVANTFFEALEATK